MTGRKRLSGLSIGGFSKKREKAWKKVPRFDVFIKSTSKISGQEGETFRLNITFQKTNKKTLRPNASGDGASNFVVELFTVSAYPFS